MKARINTNKKHELTRMKKNGQTIIEYVAVIACIIAAFLTAQFYVRRAMQGRLREASDQIGEQYEPRATSGGFTTEVSRDIDITIESIDLPDGEEGYTTHRTETINEDKTTRLGKEIVGILEK